LALVEAQGSDIVGGGDQSAAVANAVAGVFDGRGQEVGAHASSLDSDHFALVSA
jgi:hypothetical protein